ncbi:GM19489, partial [Drosophila sechellia]
LNAESGLPKTGPRWFASCELPSVVRSCPSCPSWTWLTLARSSRTRTALDFACSATEADDQGSHDFASYSADLLLPRRSIYIMSALARYEFTHEILARDQRDGGKEATRLRHFSKRTLIVAYVKYHFLTASVRVHIYNENLFRFGDQLMLYRRRTATDYTT